MDLRTVGYSERPDLWDGDDLFAGVWPEYNLRSSGLAPAVLRAMAAQVPRT